VKVARRLRPRLRRRALEAGRLRIRIGDMFAGAGGTGTGCELALLELGLEPDMLIINHWLEALLVHQKNHPTQRHFKANVFRFDPKKAVPSGKLDFLMASPTCTTFSRAKGGQPISWDQRYGRMTPRQVIRWCRELEPTCLLVENVPEFVEWGPLMRLLDENGVQKRDENGRPLWTPNPKKRKKHFFWWLGQLKKLGYRFEHNVLNCADYGDATTRKRFFLIARKDGQPIAWPEETHAPADEIQRDLFGAAKRPHRAAREVIRWEIKGRSIFTRKKPLEDKTLIRIYRGIVKFGWPAVFQVKLRLYMEALGIEVPEVATEASASALVMRTSMPRSNGLCVWDAATDPLRTVTTDGGLGVLEPLLLPRHSDHGNGSRALPTNKPMPTLTCGTPAGYLIEPFLFPANQGKDRARDLRSTDEPLDTVVAKDMKALVEPFVLSQGAGGEPRQVSQPIPTVPTRGAHAIVSSYYSNGGERSTEQPLATVTTKDRFGLIVPVTHEDAANRARSTDQALPTVTGANRGELSFISPAWGERKGQDVRVHSVDGPLPTLCATGRMPLVHGVLEADLERVDILFRMLEPVELSASHSFPEGYFDGTGLTKTEIIRMIGNSVPVCTAKALVAAIFKTWKRIFKPRKRRIA
jgi:DNA (cytosine-5)-methyltransferase 1